MNFFKTHKNDFIKIGILLLYAVIIFLFSNQMLKKCTLWNYEKNMRLLLILFTFIFFEYSLFFDTKKRETFFKLIYKILPSLALIILFPYIGSGRLKYMPLLLPGILIYMSYGLMSSLLLQAFTITFYYYTGFIDIEILILFIIFFMYVYFLAKYCDRLNHYILMCLITIFSYIVLSLNYQYMLYEKINLYTLFIGIIPLLITILPLYTKNILKSINRIYLSNKLKELCDDENELMLILMDKNEEAYFHSMRVADVSEKVARELHANVLLTKAGARFHEIGKIKSSDYIATGINIMKENKFPNEVIKIVREHNSKTYKPKNLESAIVMLADSIETTLSAVMETRGNQFNAKRIVENIIDIRFDTGMLDDSIKDLEEFKKLRKAFISIYS